MRKIYNGICGFCGNEFVSIDIRKKFCNHSCSAKHGCKNRIYSEETKKRISESLKKHYKENGCQSDFDFSQSGRKASKGKYNKDPQSLIELSKRTITKIAKRLKLSCSKCGWDKAVCDIHHINGRKIEDPHNHKNLTYLCPNCHREVHSGLIKKEELISLDIYIGDRWKEYYYG